MVERTDWTDEENLIVIDAYFDMLHRDRVGRKFVKADYIRSAHAQIPHRSEKAISYKFRNISAVLDDAGYRYLTGYVPAPNYQDALYDLVIARVSPDKA